VSRLARMASALERALQTRRPVLVYGAWQPIGSLPAAVATLVLSAIHRLRGVPLNPTITSTPFARADDLALERGVRVSRVVASRKGARVRRVEAGGYMPGDLERCDWDIPAQLAARDAPTARLGLKSFVAVDRITAEGRVALGSRPSIGQHARNGVRLPQLRTLATRASTDAAIDAFLKGDLLLISLSGAPGPKTVELVAAALRRVPSDQPALILAECAAELSRFSNAPVLAQVGNAIALAPAPRVPKVKVRLIGQARVQYEEQFRFAMPSDDLSPQERELADLGLAAWRQRWRTINADLGSAPLRDNFLRSLSDLRRRSPSAADRFNMFLQLLTTSESDASASASERLRAAIDEASHSLDTSTSRLLAVVGSRAEEVLLSQSLAGLRPAVAVALSRQLGRMRAAADAVIVCGYYGPATLDGVLRARPGHVTLVVDPIEARQASWELHRQAALLKSLGLGDMADVLGAFDSALCDSASGTRAATSESHPHLFGVTRDGAGGHYRDASEDSPMRVEEVDSDADYSVVLLDGTSLRVNANRRFDVLRSQSPHPQLLRASELQEGDEILLVRGSYQETLSELLLEDMDRTLLQDEARARRTWVVVAQTAMATSGLTLDAVARKLRSQGINVSRQNIRSWLREDNEETTPRDWTRFLLFAREIGIALPEDQLRYYHNSIRRWRVEHRKRGRAVIRALRHAYFGGLSASDMARIQAEWGLGVRDLIEGCRVEEVEAVHPLR
jgi:hypothetical protein